KLTWLKNLITHINTLIENSSALNRSEIRELVYTLGNDPDFLSKAENSLLLNDLTKKQRKSIADLLPSILLAYAEKPDAVHVFIHSNKTIFLANPCEYYIIIIQVIKHLTPDTLNKIDHFILTTAFKYPRFLHMINHQQYYNNIYYALYQCANDVVPPSDEHTPALLYCLQFFDTQPEVLSFIRFVNGPQEIPKIKQKLYVLAHYINIIQRSNLPFDDKHNFCLKLALKFKENHAKFDVFDDDISNIASIAGYEYQSLLTIPKSNDLIASLLNKINRLNGKGKYKNLLFNHAFNMNNSVVTNNSLTLTGKTIDFTPQVTAPVRDDAFHTVHNHITINVSCLYYPDDKVVQNGKIGANNKLTVFHNDTPIFGDEFDSVTVVGPKVAQTQMIALISVYEGFIQNALRQTPGVNFLHFGVIEASYNIRGFSKDFNKYYDLTTWRQDNIAAATYAQLAHDSKNMANIYQGREEDEILKLNAACQLFEHGLNLYMLLNPFGNYTIQDDKLIHKINLANMHTDKELINILGALLKYNDLKQFNRGICSQKNLNLIAKLFGCGYRVGHDNIATLLCRYQQSVIKSSFGDQLYAQLGFLLRGVIDEEQFFAAIKQCDHLAAIDPDAQAKLLRRMAALAPKSSDTHSPVLASSASANLTTAARPNLARQNTILTSTSDFNDLTF
ncbi:MAG: hypothetical protein ABSF18_04285, partial [Gammaproteobacteria bacterium]